MFYLTTYLTHLLLYSIIHMVKDHLDSERKPATTRATLSDWQQGVFYMHRIRHTTGFVTPVMEYWLE